jgi:threonine dehydrogenase-like Zn-dependent dehydrogenase
MPRVGEAVIRVTLTTICGTDLHILKGEYQVKPGLIIGHEPVGTIHQLGEGITGYEVGDRVLVGAITPCGQCNFCLAGNWSQCGGPLGGWKFGNTINGAQAEYLLVPHAQANLAKIPDELTDEQVVLLADIASTGISAAESADPADRRRGGGLCPRPHRPVRNGRSKAERCEPDHRGGV